MGVSKADFCARYEKRIGAKRHAVKQGIVGAMGLERALDGLPLVIVVTVVTVVIVVIVAIHGDVRVESIGSIASAAFARVHLLQVS